MVLPLNQPMSHHVADASPPHPGLMLGILTAALYPRYGNVLDFDQDCCLTNTQLFYVPFFQDYPGEPVPEESSSGLYGARKDNRGRRTNNPAGCQSIRTNQQPTSNRSSTHFYAGCPSCCNPPNLCWLGTGTKYAALHIQCLG